MRSIQIVRFIRILESHLEIIRNWCKVCSQIDQNVTNICTNLPVAGWISKNKWKVDRKRRGFAWLWNIWTSSQLNSFMSFFFFLILFCRFFHSILSVSGYCNYFFVAKKFIAFVHWFRKHACDFVHVCVCV